MRYIEGGTKGDIISAIDNGKSFKLYITKNNRTIFQSNRVALDGLSMNHGLVITEVANGNDDFKPGSTMCTQVTMTFIKGQVPSELKVNKWFILLAVVEDEVPEKIIIIGMFCPSEIIEDTSGEFVTVVSYDKMKQISEIPVASFLDYAKTNYSGWITPYGTVTVATFFYALGEYVGLTYNTRFSPDYDIGYAGFTVASRLLDEQMLNRIDKKISCRDLMSILCEAAYGFGKIGVTYTASVVHDTFELGIFEYDRTKYALTVPIDNIFSYEFPNKYPAITWNEFDQMTWNEADMKNWEEIEGTDATYAYDYIKYSRVGNGEIVAEKYPNAATGKHLDLSSNPFLQVYTQQDIRDYIRYYDHMLKKIGGTPYSKVVAKGYFLASAGDLIRVEKEDGSYTYFHIHKQTTTWKGGMVEETYEVYGTASSDFNDGVNEDFQKEQTDLRLYNLENKMDAIEGIIPNKADCIIVSTSTSNTSFILYLKNGSRAVMLSSGPGSNRSGAWGIGTNASGNPYAYNIVSSSQVTFDTSVTNTITINCSVANSFIILPMIGEITLL